VARSERAPEKPLAKNLAGKTHHTYNGSRSPIKALSHGRKKEEGRKGKGGTIKKPSLVGYNGPNGILGDEPGKHDASKMVGRTE